MNCKPNAFACVMKVIYPVLFFLENTKVCFRWYLTLDGLRESKGKLNVQSDQRQCGLCHLSTNWIFLKPSHASLCHVISHISSIITYSYHHLGVSYTIRFSIIPSLLKMEAVLRSLVCRSIIL
jgi:hypothetical protein